MTHRQLIKRVITCQGSIQLVTALSVLSHREEDQHQGYEYENYLVIYDLFAPPDQMDAFVALIKKMAERICNWKAIVHITPEHLESITRNLNFTGSSKIFQIVHELVGIDSPDEIYLCRNWQIGNQLLINAYQSCQKICYGDGIGIYFPQNSTALFAVVKPSNKPNFLQSIKANIKAAVNNIQHHLNIKTILKRIQFDVGYFVLPNIMGESPPMKTVTIDKATILKVFQKLRGLVEPEYLTYLQQKIASAPISVLLTSNFSEAGRMSIESEIAAYRQFLMSEGIEKNTVLVLKPHPRDNEDKIRKLEFELADLYVEVLSLSKPDLFFLPFEVLFLEAFLKLDLTPVNNIGVFAVSSACLSLSLLFKVPSIIGFGKRITSDTFYEDYVDGRLQHERDLRAAIEQIQ